MIETYLFAFFYFFFALIALAALVGAVRLGKQMLYLLQDVRWGFCLKQSGLGFVVALLTTPNLGTAGALAVGWFTPLVVSILFSWVTGVLYQRQTRGA